MDFYKDIYRDSCWCLEIFSGEASKRSAALRLKKMCGADYLIGFGDGSMTCRFLRPVMRHMQYPMDVKR